MATIVFLTSGSSWPVPADCSGTLDSVEVIGGGVGGGAGATPRSNVGGGGGGGGAYSKVLSLAVSGSVSYSIGATTANLGTAGDTWFKSTGDVLAKGGSATIGGVSASGVGSTKFSGGTGGLPTQSTGGGGGGGAGGPNGAGVTVTTPNQNGGAGDNGSGGAGGSGGAPPTVGSPGAEWTATAGGTAGSGGGGGGRQTSVGAGAAGGLYGSGGGGGFGVGNAGGAGQSGLIVITYTPTGGGLTWSNTSNSFELPAKHLVRDMIGY